MISRLTRLLAPVAALLLAIVGCRSMPVEQAAPPVSRLAGDSSQAALLETGRALYTGQCARCHRPKPVQDYSAEDWSGRILPKMAKKAKLKADETAAVLAYVLAARTIEPGIEPTH